MVLVVAGYNMYFVEAANHLVITYRSGLAPLSSRNLLRNNRV